jgi:subtilisin family serine protease
MPPLTYLTKDPDPLDICVGHGTHVAGIIAADARNANASQPFVGVASAVKINAYRVFGCTGGVSDDVLISAMTTAAADGVDIISMSLGASSGWSETPSSVVASRVADTGIFLSIAAGNSGSEGLFDSEAPATGSSVAAVASIDNIKFVAYIATTPQNQSIVIYLLQTLLI